MKISDEFSKYTIRDVDAFINNLKYDKYTIKDVDAFINNLKWKIPAI